MDATSTPEPEPIPRSLQPLGILESLLLIQALLRRSDQQIQTEREVRKEGQKK